MCVCVCRTGLGVVGVQTLIGQLLQEDKERLKEFEKDKQVRRVVHR